MNYYTPTIEEFHVGFEFYLYIAGSNTLYESGVFDINNFTLIRNIYNQNLQDGWLKVKCLDDDDILSLGFVKDGGEFINPDFKISLINDFDLIAINKIYEFESSFVGKVKNKSELKVILRQVVDGN